MKRGRRRAKPDHRRREFGRRLEKSWGENGREVYSLDAIGVRVWAHMAEIDQAEGRDPDDRDLDSRARDYTRKVFDGSAPIDRGEADAHIRAAGLSDEERIDLLMLLGFHPFPDDPECRRVAAALFDVMVEEFPDILAVVRGREGARGQALGRSDLRKIIRDWFRLD